MYFVLKVGPSGFWLILSDHVRDVARSWARAFDLIAVEGGNHPMAKAFRHHRCRLA
jgi:hypothetical protein